MLWNIHGREVQLLVCTHLGKQFQVGIYCFLADPKVQQDCPSLFFGRVFLHGIRVVLGPSHSNLNSVVVQTTHAYYHEHGSIAEA